MIVRNTVLLLNCYESKAAKCKQHTKRHKKNVSILQLIVQNIVVRKTEKLNIRITFIQL